MAVVNLDNVAASVPKRFEMLEKKGRIGYFPKCELFEAILDNPVPGGGSSVSLTVTVGSPEFATSTGDFVEINDNTEGNQLELNFGRYRNITGGFQISQRQLNQISNGGKGIKAYLDRQIMIGTEGYKDNLESNAYQSDGTLNTFLGFKSFWTGASYGGVDRADEGPTGIPFSLVLGDETPYLYNPYNAMLDAAVRAQTRWDATDFVAAAIADGVSREQAARKVLRALMLHIAKTGEKPTHIQVGTSVYEALMDLLDNTANPASLGIVKSFTAAGDDQMSFLGRPLRQSDKIGHDEALLLNKRYIMTPCIDGFSLKKPEVEVEKSNKYAKARRVDILGTGSIVTDVVTKHGWVTNVLG